MILLQIIVSLALLFGVGLCIREAQRTRASLLEHLMAEIKALLAMEKRLDRIEAELSERAARKDQWTRAEPEKAWHERT